MSVSVNISLVLPDSVARDLTQLRKGQTTGTTAIIGDIDDKTTSVTFKDAGAVGCQVLLTDTGELMTITAMPSTEGGPCTVSRGDCGDTAIPDFPSAAATAHADGAQVFILKYAGLIDMGRSAALGVIQGYIQRMGPASETLGAALAAKQAAEQAAQDALNSVIAQN